MTETSALDAIHNNISLVREITLDMRRIAQAAQIMGQRDLSDELNCMASDLNDGAKKAGDAYARELHNNVMDSQRNINETLKLVLDSTLIN